MKTKRTPRKIKNLRTGPVFEVILQVKVGDIDILLTSHSKSLSFEDREYSPADIREISGGNSCSIHGVTIIEPPSITVNLPPCIWKGIQRNRQPISARAAVLHFKKRRWQKIIEFEDVSLDLNPQQ